MKIIGYFARLLFCNEPYSDYFYLMSDFIINSKKSDVFRGLIFSDSEFESVGPGMYDFHAITEEAFFDIEFEMLHDMVPDATDQRDLVIIESIENDLPF